MMADGPLSNAIAATIAVTGLDLLATKSRATADLMRPARCDAAGNRRAGETDRDARSAHIHDGQELRDGGVTDMEDKTGNGMSWPYPAVQRVEQS